MERYSGVAVCGGVAAGPAAMQKKEDAVARGGAQDARAQIERFEKAVREAKKRLEELFLQASLQAGDEAAAVFKAQQMILADEEFSGRIVRTIREEKINAEYAVSEAGAYFSGIFENLEDAYMRARAADIREVAQLLAQALGGAAKKTRLQRPSVVLADALTPAQLLEMDREMLLAVVTVQGTPFSHAAILARALHIPAVTGVNLPLDTIKEGTPVLVDGFSGEVILKPGEADVRAARQREDAARADEAALQALKGKESVTGSGKRIRLYANIGSIGEARRALEGDAEGIGLFRSEFLFLGRETLPDEEEQYQTYREVLRIMGGRQVVIRTLDIGADKQAPGWPSAKEENPALGCRGVRMCLKRPELFKVQLRALLRAACFGDLAVLYPMIISEEEVRRVRALAGEAYRELKEEKTPCRMPKQGIMIETPAAVMLSDRLAQITDFFSIGTNDLTQYALALDRENVRLKEFYPPDQEAVLRMIRMTVDSAHRYGKPVGICGDLGADLKLTEEFVKMGVDVLSAAPEHLLPLRRRIREIK